MDRHEAEELLERYRAGTCTAEERRLVEAWFNRELSESQWDAELDWEAAKAAIWQRVVPTTSRPKRLRRWLPYAAAILVVATTVTWMFVDSPLLNRARQTINLESADIPPGGNRATLTLTDGRTLTLDEARDGIVIGSGEITYNDGNPLADVDGPGEAALLELTTPKGGTYQITLSDGTQVWLNAASTLRYPSTFKEDERVVEIVGEAYFDVAQMRKSTNSRVRTATASLHVPFKVVTESQIVEVLGTEFNISTYVGDPETRTTLVEGKVKVSNQASHTTRLLTPGQQAVTYGANIDIKQVDVGQYSAWKDGWIVFQDKSFDQIMYEVERWYDIDVRYEGAIPDEVGYGMTKRTENLSAVLKLLESGGIRFRMDDRTLTIINQ